MGEIGIGDVVQVRKIDCALDYHLGRVVGLGPSDGLVVHMEHDQSTDYFHPSELARIGKAIAMPDRFTPDRLAFQVDDQPF